MNYLSNNSKTYTLCSLGIPGILVEGSIITSNYLIAKNKPLETSKFGKLKTVFQHGMVLLILLVNPSQAVVNFIVYINAIYAAATGIHYFVKNGF